MRVLQINSVCGIRSTGRICTDIADILTANRHDCKIAYGRESVPEKYQKYAVRIGSNFDVNMHALRSRIFDDSGFGSRCTTETFIRLVKEYDPDVIHLHNIHGYYINIEVLFNYLKESGKPVIWKGGEAAIVRIARRKKDIRQVSCLTVRQRTIYRKKPYFPVLRI